MVPRFKPVISLNMLSREFFMVKYVINLKLLSVIKNIYVITMSVITRVDFITKKTKFFTVYCT